MKWRTVGFLTVVVVVVVVVVFGLVIYADPYRPRPHAPNAQNAPTPVLVAKLLIPKGTPGSLIARQEMYVPTTLPRKEVEVDAIIDPSYLVGRAAATDILPGDQITVGDFSARAIWISIDNLRGNLSKLQAGDHVDVYTRTPRTVLRLFMTNVEVLAVPLRAGPSGIILEPQTSYDAARLRNGADNTQLWLKSRS